MAKYGKIGTRYFSVGDRSQIQEVSESDVIARRGTIPRGTNALGLIRQEGDIEDIDPAQLTRDPGGALRVGGRILSLGGSQAFATNQGQLSALGLPAAGAPPGQLSTDRDYAQSLIPGYRESGPVQQQVLSSKQEGGQIVSVRRDNANNFYGIDANGNERKLTEQEAFANGLGINETFVKPEQTVSLNQAITGRSQVDTNRPSPSTVESQPFTQDSRFQKAFEQAKASGLPEPSSGAEARAVVQQYAPSQGKPTSTPSVDNFFVSNPFVQQSTEQMMELLSPQSTRDSLKTYLDQLAVDRKELSGLKTEYMNNKRIMSGTRDQLAQEIEKGGGFATSGQVDALAVSRNKSLIQRNSELSDLISSQQDAVNTDTQLLQFEKSLASEQFTQRMSLMNYQRENYEFMFNAAKDTYKTLIDKSPQGLYDSLIADPARAQRFTSITGVGIDALKGLATEKVLAQQEKQLDLGIKRTQLAKGKAELAGVPLDIEYKQAQIENIYSQIAERDESNTVMTDPFGKVMVKPKEALKINKELVGNDAYKSITKAKDSLQFLKNFEDTFKKTGATSAIFSPRQNAKLKAEYNAAILNLKEFFNLGVLNGPDEAILRGVLPDPTSRSAILAGLSLGIYKPSASTKAGIESMKKMIEATLDDRYKSLSAQYGDYSSLSVSGIGDLNRVYVEQKAKVNPNIQKLINENPNLTPDDILTIMTQ